MSNYLAIDCGGTKVAAILYDENLRRRAVCVTGSVRANTTDETLIRKHTEELISALGLTGLTVDSCGGVCERSLTEAIGRVGTVRRITSSGELELGLAAAGVFGDGLLAICGTGATMFARVGGTTLVAGGYGAAVADEGSGYYVGREGLIAAIRDSEGRGEHTALTELLPVHFGYGGPEELRPAIFSIYGRSDRSPAACVADCAPVVVRAAEQGDAVAGEMLADAGRLLGQQMGWLIEKNGLPDSLPIALSGSMWRGNPILYHTFLETVSSQCGTRQIIIPRMEPVLGVLARQIFESDMAFTEDSIGRLLSEYPEFEYDIRQRKNG